MNERNHPALQRRMILKRVLVYGAAVFILGILQCSFFSRLKPFGATPDLILGVICAIALIDNKESAAVTALAGGFFIDALGAVTPSFSTLFYTVCAAVAIIIAEKLMPKLISFAIIMLPALALRAAYTFICARAVFGEFPTAQYLSSVILPEAISTLVFGIIAYYTVKLCSVLIGARSRFSF